MLAGRRRSSRFVAWIVDNTSTNLRRANIASGFGFLGQRAGFDISQSLISVLARTRPTAARFLVGLLNTLLVAALGIVFATILGFVVGIARLSTNWLIAQARHGLRRDAPQHPAAAAALFWYLAVLSVLPAPRQGYALPLRRQSQQSRPAPAAADLRRRVRRRPRSRLLVGDRRG